MRRVAGFLCAFLLVVPAARAEISGAKVKIGVLTDLSGPYEAGAGMGSVEAAKIAAEEFGYKINGVPIEIISADHQNKPDIGASIARRWFDPYFFLSNGQYVRYSIQQDKIDPGYPKPIDDATWPGCYSGALASALNWKDGKIEFFLTNGQYIRYDVANDHADRDYPKDITQDTWPGLENYKSLLAGAFNRENGKAYIFLKDGRYIRYDINADRADAGYPKAIDEQTWPGMNSALGGR
jgi:hypothetical protein